MCSAGLARNPLNRTGLEADEVSNYFEIKTLETRSVDERDKFVPGGFFGRWHVAMFLGFDHGNPGNLHDESTRFLHKRSRIAPGL